MFCIITAFIAAFWKGVMFGSGRRYAWPVVNRFIDILPKPWTLAPCPTVKVPAPSSMDLGPGLLERLHISK